MKTLQQIVCNRSGGGDGGGVGGGCDGGYDGGGCQDDELFKNVKDF